MDHKFERRHSQNIKVNHSTYMPPHLYDYIPLILILVFNILTYLIFLFGPWNWPVISYVKINLFMFSVFMSIFIGYRRGVCKNIQISKVKEKSLFLFNMIVYLQIVLIPITLIQQNHSGYNY